MSTALGIELGVTFFVGVLGSLLALALALASSGLALRRDGLLVAMGCVSIAGVVALVLVALLLSQSAVVVLLVLGKVTPRIACVSADGVLVHLWALS